MSQSSIDSNVGKMSFVASLIFIIAGIASLFFSLYPVGDGVADKALWITNNSANFMIGWSIQIILVFTLLALISGVAWQFFSERPIRAVATWLFAVLSSFSFLIPKFMAVWSIPLMAAAVVGNTAEAGMGAQLLNAFDVAVPFSIFTSLDYLGYWLYATFSILVARPLFSAGVSGKLAAAFFFAYGVGLYIAIGGVLTAAWPAESVGAIADSLNNLLFLAVIAITFHFKSAESLIAETA